MKSDMLFGVKLANNEEWKTLLLNNYAKWKDQELQYYNSDVELIAHVIKPMFNLSHEEALREIYAEFPAGEDYPDTEEVRSLLKEDGCRHYYITNPVLAMCEKIKIKEPFDLEGVNLKDGKKQLNLGDQFIRYQKSGDRIVIFSAVATKMGNDYSMDYTFFHVDSEAHKLSHPLHKEEYKKAAFFNSPRQQFKDQSRKLFYQLITFIELAEIKEVFLSPGKKHGVRKDKDNLLNVSKFPITIVNTAWHKIIRTTGFDVDGHLRKQPWGPGRTQRRLIWIDPFHKNGYNLGVKKNDRNKGRSM